jgi:hypothetical protein
MTIATSTMRTIKAIGACATRFANDGATMLIASAHSKDRNDRENQLASVERRGA